MTETPALSASIAKILIADSPLHAWTAHRLLNPDFEREEKESFDLGTVCHEIMLEGESKAIVLDINDWRTKAAQEARAMAYAEGKTPILRKHWDRVLAMVAAGKKQIAAHREASDAFTDGEAEFKIEWDEETPHGFIRCKGRIDWLHNSKTKFEDYKTVGNTANPEAIAGMVINAGWPIQDAFYRRGIRAVFGKEATGLFIAQETAEPFALSVIGMSPELQWLGDSQVQRAIELWAQCVDSNSWPGYPDRICFPLLPKWSEDEELRRQEESVHGV